jgi:uncharacterized protein
MDMLEEKIIQDYWEAMKKKDALKSTVLNCLRAEILNAAIAKSKKKLADEDIVALIRKQIKAHHDSVEQFTKGARQDLADKEAKEMEILKNYLPQELSPEEIKQIIEEAHAAVGAQGIKDMGKLMKEVNLKVAGRADGKVVSDLVKARLTM